MANETNWSAFFFRKADRVFAGFEFDYSSRPQARNGRDGGKVFAGQSISLPFIFIEDEKEASR